MVASQNESVIKDVSLTQIGAVEDDGDYEYESEFLWVVPDWSDVCNAGRSIEVRLPSFALHAAAADDLDALADLIEEGELLLERSKDEPLRRTRVTLASCRAVIDFDTSAELAAVLLRAGANHLRWAQETARGEWIVLSDPHEVLSEFGDTPFRPRLERSAVDAIAINRYDIGNPQALYGLPLSRATRGWGWAWLEAAVLAGHLPHFEGIELAARATVEAFANEIEVAEHQGAGGDAVGWAETGRDCFARLAEIAESSRALFSAYLHEVGASE